MFCNPLINTTGCNGYVQVCNRGAFVAYFNIIYYVNGQFNTIDSCQILALQSSKLIVPYNATQIHLSVYYAIYFSTWFIMYNRYFNCPPKKCYTLYGTVSNPSCVEVPCHSNRIIYPINNHTYCN